jgi:hypothetical protein
MTEHKQVAPEAESIFLPSVREDWASYPGPRVRIQALGGRDYLAPRPVLASDAIPVSEISDGRGVSFDLAYLPAAATGLAVHYLPGQPAGPSSYTKPRRMTGEAVSYDGDLVAVRGGALLRDSQIAHRPDVEWLPVVPIHVAYDDARPGVDLGEGPVSIRDDEYVVVRIPAG